MYVSKMLKKQTFSRRCRNIPIMYSYTSHNDIKIVRTSGKFANIMPTYTIHYIILCYNEYLRMTMLFGCSQYNKRNIQIYNTWSDIVMVLRQTCVMVLRHEILRRTSIIMCNLSIMMILL